MDSLKELAMAKKPMTKAQIVSHFAGKFKISRKTALATLEDVTGLPVSEIDKIGSITIPGVGKMVRSRRKTGIHRITGGVEKIRAKSAAKNKSIRGFTQRKLL